MRDMTKRNLNISAVEPYRKCFIFYNVKEDGTKHIRSKSQKHICPLKSCILRMGAFDFFAVEKLKQRKRARYEKMEEKGECVLSGLEISIRY